MCGGGAPYSSLAEGGMRQDRRKDRNSPSKTVAEIEGVVGVTGHVYTITRTYLVSISFLLRLARRVNWPFLNRWPIIYFEQTCTRTRLNRLSI